MRIPGALRSPKLALALCLAAALHASIGTPVPAERAERFVRERLGDGVLQLARFLGVVDTYASPLFIGLLLTIAVNLAACTWHRADAMRRSRPAGHARSALDLLMHFSVLLVLLGGAIKGSLGSASTQYLFVDQTATTARSGGFGPERPLGFGLLLKERVEEHFPFALQVEVRNARSGERFPLLTIREGRGGQLPEQGLRLEVGRFDVAQRRVTVRAVLPGADVVELRFDLVPEGRTSERLGNYEVQLMAWRRDLKGVRGRIAVIDGGREVKEEWLGTNERIAYRGSNIYLTGWGEDMFKNQYLGVQVTRDPGAPLFWAGAALFALATPLFLMVRHSGGTGDPDGRV